jgi:hypothetical protein
MRVFEELAGGCRLRWWYKGESKAEGLYMSDGSIACPARYSISDLTKGNNVRELTPEEIEAIPYDLRPKESDWRAHAPNCQLETLIRRLDRIAKANDDEFVYNVKVETVKPNGLLYRLEITEKAEGHCFTSGMGKTIEAAVDDAEEAIEGALTEWGYEEPK